MSVQISESNLNISNPVTGEYISSIPITTNQELQIILDKAVFAAKTYNYSSFFLIEKYI